MHNNLRFLNIVLLLENRVTKSMFYILPLFSPYFSPMFSNIFSFGFDFCVSALNFLIFSIFLFFYLSILQYNFYSLCHFRSNLYSSSPFNLSVNFFICIFSINANVVFKMMPNRLIIIFKILPKI